MLRILSAVLLLVLLASCDTQLRPAKMHGDARHYIGRWVHDWVDPGDATSYVRVYLEVAPDAKAIYKRCIRNAPQQGSNQPVTNFVVIDHDAVLSRAIGYRILQVEYRRHFWIEEYSFHGLRPPLGLPGRHDRTVWLDGIELKELAPADMTDHQAWDCGP